MHLKPVVWMEVPQEVLVQVLEVWHDVQVVEEWIDGKE